MIDSGVDSKGEAIRMLVATAIKAYKSEHLFDFLEDKSVIVRSAAARELQLRGGAATFKRTVALLANKHARTREVAAFILGQLGTPKRLLVRQSARALLKALDVETSSQVKSVIITSLGQLRSRKEVVSLLGYAGDRSPSVRASIAFAIGYVNSSKPISASVQRTLDKLGQDKSSAVREAALLAAELIGGGSRRGKA
ncbi:MAG: HEAT repeat domain-containing protein [Proteobacteria bacterium]|nr:HEAT repeat domain-containing protein [Pseudomonadota bacterium]